MSKLKIKMFYRAAGCSNCEKQKPIFAKFKDANPNVECTQIEENDARDEIAKYAPKTQWMMPLIVYFYGDQAIASSTGVNTVEQLEKPIKKAMYYSTFDVNKLKVTLFDKAQESDDMLEKSEKMKAAAMDIALEATIIRKIIDETRPKEVPEIKDPAEDTGCPGCE